MTDPYAILGVTPDASDDEIREAYRKLAQRWHPDKHPNDVAGATIKFQEIDAAYTVLSDGSKRARYDDLGEAEPTKENEITSAAIQLLAQAELEVIDHPGDHLAYLRNKCEAIIAHHNALIQDAQMSIRKRQQSAKRWKTKQGGRNIFANAIRRDVQRLRKSVETFKDVIKLARECLRILTEYEFQQDGTRQQFGAISFDIGRLT